MLVRGVIMPCYERERYNNKINTGGPCHTILVFVFFITRSPSYFLMVKNCFCSLLIFNLVTRQKKINLFSIWTINFSDICAIYGCYNTVFAQWKMIITSRDKNVNFWSLYIFIFNLICRLHLVITPTSSKSKLKTTICITQKLN